jgi:hypothetical protein
MSVNFGLLDRLVIILVIIINKKGIKQISVMSAWLQADNCSTLSADFRKRPPCETPE